MNRNQFEIEIIMYTLPIEVNQLGTTFSLPFALPFSKDRQVKTLLSNQITYYERQNKILKSYLSDYLEEGTVEEATKSLLFSKMLIPHFEVSLVNIRLIKDKIYEPTLLNLHTELVKEMSIFLSHLNSFVAFSNAIVEGQYVDEENPNYIAFASSLASSLSEAPTSRTNPNFWNNL